MRFSRSTMTFLAIAGGLLMVKKRRMHRVKKMAVTVTVMVTYGLSVSAANGDALYVDAAATDMPHNGSAWCNAFLNLQGALAVVVSGDTVQVAEGTYMPDGGYTPVGGAHVAGSGDRTVTFQLINGVTLQGGYAGCGAPDPGERDVILHETILNGDLIGDDADVPCTVDSPDCDSFGRLCANNVCIIRDNNVENSYHVVIGSGTDDTAVLDGFTITEGNADGSDPNDLGGGMYNEMGGPRVSNCTFRRNSAFFDGGGICNRTRSHPTVTNCTFRGNSAGSGSSGGGMFNTNTSSPTVTNCIFSGNSANFGGGMRNDSGSHPTLTNCTFTGNLANGGGGVMYNTGGCDPTMTNCTFSGNSANGNGGGILNEQSLNSPVFVNSILWGNVADADGDSGGPFMDESAQIQDDGMSKSDVNYSCVQGTWTGNGGNNIDTDPMFVDANGPDNVSGTDDDDLRLRPGSPAIDTGNNEFVTQLEDLDGNQRIVDCIVDMGAYEFGSSVCLPENLACQDCNGNAVPDECDIANCPQDDPACQDCNGDGRPDECGVLDQCAPERLAPQPPAPGDPSDVWFGSAVSVDGDTTAVGVFNDDCPTIADCGSVYTFRLTDGAWIFEQKFTPSDPDVGFFGHSVSIHGDTIVTGAPGSRCVGGSATSGCGSAYVFRRVNGSWIEEQRLAASDPSESAAFGVSVSVSGDIIVAGTSKNGCVNTTGSEQGSVYVFRRVEGNWVEEQKLIHPAGTLGTCFGYSVAVDANTAVVGSIKEACVGGPECGAAYVFGFDGANWISNAKLSALDGATGDRFGYSLSLSGNSVVVGAYRHDHAGVFDPGSAYVFVEPTSGWSNMTETAEFTASDAAAHDGLGVSVATTGGIIAAGAQGDDCPDQGNCGSVYVFTRPVNGWTDSTETIKLDAPNGFEFGNAVAVSASWVAGAAQREPCSAGESCGAVYLFRMDAPDCNCNGISDECDIARSVPTFPEPLNSYAASDMENQDGSDFDPRIATDGQGNWVATWHTQYDLGGTIGGDLDVLFSRSTDNGKNWTPAEHLNSNAPDEDRTDRMDDGDGVATDGLGNWVAVWEAYIPSCEQQADFDIALSRSTYDGATWSDWSGWELLNTNGECDNGQDGNPRVATDGQGIWVAVWHSTEPNIAPGIGTDQDILFACSEDNGVSWSDPAWLNTDASDEDRNDIDVRVATDGLGNWVAVWETPTEGGVTPDVFVARSIGNGLNCPTVWTAPVPFSTDSGLSDFGTRPKVVTDGQGNWVVVWQSKDDLDGTIGTDSDILVARSTDNGETWTAPTALNSNAVCDSSNGDPQLKTDGQGNWVAVWHSSANLGGTIGTDPDILFSRSEDNGETWTPPMVLNTNADSDAGSDSRPHLATDEAGNWMAVWQSNENLGGMIGTDTDILVTLFQLGPADCNGNGIPDECDIANCVPGNPACADCNGNGIPDVCDIVCPAVQDCNGNGIPDECEAGDANGNGIPDSCEPCEFDEMCDEGLFCTGMETCDVPTGECIPGMFPCPDGQGCFEDTDTCGPCVTDEQCDDHIYCNGLEICDEGVCRRGIVPCTGGLGCDESTQTCITCTSDDDCEDGIDCTIDACAVNVCEFTPNGCVGACCFSNGSCVEDQLESNCIALGGRYLGDELTCTSDPDRDGCAGCDDLCPRDPLKCDPLVCGCGESEADSDGDGVPDCADHCPNTPPGEPVDFCGCPFAGACCSGDGQGCLDDVTEAFCDGIGNFYQGNGTACPCPDEPVVCGPDVPPFPHDRPKNRYISFAPNLPNQLIRFKVTVTGSLPHPGLVGSSWWAQEPVTPIPGQFPRPALGAGECAAILGAEATAARIDWDAAGCQVLHVTGCPIEPTSEYDVQAVAGTNESEPLTVATILKPGAKWWGDIVGFLDGTEWTPPQGVTNIDDALAAIKTFQGGPVVPPGPIPPGNVAHLSVPDVDPGNINTVVNFNDVFTILLAFQGEMYPFGPADADGDCP